MRYLSRRVDTVLRLYNRQRMLNAEFCGVSAEPFVGGFCGTRKSFICVIVDDHNSTWGEIVPDEF
jgi:hypothetical protein